MINDFLRRGFDLFCSAFDLIVLVTYFKVLFNSKDKRFSKVTKYITIALIEAVLILSIYLETPPYVNIIISIATSLIITFFYHATTLNRIFSVIALQAIAMISEILGYLIGDNIYVKNSQMTFSDADINRMMLFTSKVVMFLIVVLVSFMLKRKSRHISLQYHLSLIIIPIITMVVANSLFYSISNEGTELKGVEYAAIIGLMLINVLVFYMLDNIILASELREKNSHLETQFEYQEKKYEQTSASFKRIRSLIHDTNKHLNYVDSCIREGQYDEARAYIHQAADKIDKSYMRINTGYLAIDALVSNAYDISKLNGIKFKTKIEIDPERINIERYEISVVLGNLLDNALEACKKISNVDDRIIEVNIFTTEAALVIGIINSTHEYKDINNLKTDKANTLIHGIGLSNIENIVNKYKGNFLIETEGTSFHTTVLIPLKDSKIPLGV